MFCSACGKEVNENLNFCNNCGARVGNGSLQVVNSSSPQFARSLGFIGGGGLVGFIVVLKILLDSNRLDVPAITFILFAYLVTLFLICAMIVGHIWKHSGNIKIKTNAPDKYAPPKQFRAENTAQLEPPREPFIGSVTDNTTRTLDKVELKNQRI